MLQNYIIRGQARGKLKGNWGTAILLLIVTIAITSIPNVIMSLFASNATEVVDWILSTLLGVVLAPIEVGVSWVFLSLIRDYDFKIENIFEPFKSIYKKSLITYVLKWIFTFLWTLLLIIPGIVKGIAYSQSNFILKDQPDLTPKEVITLSKNMMEGYKWKYFKLGLSFIGWGMLCILTIGIGFLWLGPYISATYAEFYNELSEIYYEENGIDREERNDETNF
ncbi:MAG: Integral rane protein [Bacillales bacterium]|jgi:uncharacterized membrane protein|nr:Integral rane protein [Bacillales bacterium]